MTMDQAIIIIEAAARAAHEANRAYCIALGDTSQMPWEEAPANIQESVREGVRGVLAGNGPRESHASFLAVKERDGWTYGEKKDLAAKTHPCMVPYDQLPPEQRKKNRIFVTLVAEIAIALGASVHPRAEH